MRSLPAFADLRAFQDHLGSAGDVARIAAPVALRHEMTPVQLAALRAGGPVLRFDHALSDAGVRVAAGLGLAEDEVPPFGAFLAALRAPAPPEGMRDALSRWPMLKAALSSRARVLTRPPVQDETLPDLSAIPVQPPWPGDAGPLVTWPVVITRPQGSVPVDVGRYNLGVYRAQVIGPDRLILRWLAHRGGAAHHRGWARAGEAMPVAVALGCNPAFLLSAALPLPETVSELTFSGVLRGARAEIAAAQTVPLMVPARAGIVVEGWVNPGDTAPEGPFGDHTGYYNAAEPFPVMQVSRITCRRDPFYLSTVTGRPPDEPSVIGAVFNDLALPVIRAQIPEVQDLWLQPAACSYRVAVVRIAKRYPGQARRVMLALCDRHHAVGDLGATIASGSCPVPGMIVAPCSMRSLSAIAQGLDDTLLTRAASVQLKERRPLILLAREGPLTLAHLRNMTHATEMGAIVMPPVPAFYLRPVTVAQITARIAARAVDLLRLAPPAAQAWNPEGDLT